MRSSDEIRPASRPAPAWLLSCSDCGVLHEPVIAMADRSTCPSCHSVRQVRARGEVEEV